MPSVGSHHYCWYCGGVWGTTSVQKLSTCIEYEQLKFIVGVIIFLESFFIESLAESGCLQPFYEGISRLQH